ncbi:hypothetical protein [Sphingobacterium hungaricum]|uniref:Uncharacterized protein n=1 Tax=Sphingobacterium hungaricum TaxID=2082723 RepID=A0A928YT40_9SPHI|nr:hypothetical protein [Sphingobacterium hungaricum]MBE8714808.1 hypothetical protein [Sphingobacterium hungaricum]
MKIFGFLVSAALVFACGKPQEKPHLEQADMTKARLKHITTKAQLVESLGNYAAGWSTGELQLTQIGTYPSSAGIYYYSLSMNNEGVSGQGENNQRISAGVDGTGEETLELILDENKNLVAVEDSRTQKFPKLFIVKNSNNKPGDWMFQLYIPQVYSNGKTAHKVSFQGFTQTPVPSDQEVVAAMLNLVEVVD